MPRPRHNNWFGFKEIRDEKNIIIAARCNTCGVRLAKKSADGLRSHRRVCLLQQAQIDAENVEYCSSKQVARERDEASTPLPSTSSKFKRNKSTERISTNYLPNCPCQSKEPQLLPSPTNMSILHQPVQSNTATGVSTDEKHVHLLNFILANNMDLDKVRAPSIVNICKAFDENYILPKTDDFKGNILKKSFEQAYLYNKQKEHCNVVDVFTDVSDSGLLFLSVLNALNGESSFLLFSHHEEVEQAENKLINFLYASISRAKNVFDVNVIYFIHDGTILVPEYFKYKNSSYCTSTRFNYVIDRLRRVEVNTTVSATPVLQEFLTIINNLQDTLKSKRLKLSDAVQELFQLINNHHVFMDSTFGNCFLDTALETITPLYLACNFFSPKHHGKYFENDRRMFRELNKFINRTAPTDSFDAIGMYICKNEPFLRFYEDGVDTNYVEFWTKAKQFCPSFSHWAVNLSNIEAISQSVDKNEFKC
ncbi:uncharacterized protein LOC111643479 [Copidosoma floridanum]|uniref:uncharacterized protein LOC111643479 n=1 Tax=Copidosoma floridanum TaxID=29053 RepID=UPI000C6F5B65|nr:uncharacterized protein LOC111643479 [Copidosoma floridanum]